MLAGGRAAQLAVACDDLEGGEAQDTRYGGTDDDGAVVVEPRDLGLGDAWSGGRGTGPVFDVQAATIDVAVPVGEVITVDSRLSWNTTVYTGESAASLDTSFAVTRTGVTDGVQVVPDGGGAAA